MKTKQDECGCIVSDRCAIHADALMLANMMHRLARELSMAHRDTGCKDSNCWTKLLLDDYDQLDRDLKR